MDPSSDDRMLTTSNEAHAGRLENVELAAGQKLTGLVLRARASASVVAKITAASGAPGAHANGVAHFAGLAGKETTTTLFSRSGVRTSLRIEDQNGARLTNASAHLVISR